MLNVELLLMIDNLTYIEAQTFSMMVMVMVGVMVVMVMMTMTVVMVMMIELLLMMDNLTDIEAHTRFIEAPTKQTTLLHSRQCCRRQKLLFCSFGICWRSKQSRRLRLR